MPATATSPENVIASCSFCGKPSTAVQRLVAGPGVDICNECVELCATIVADAARTTAEESARRRSEFHDRSAEDILATLPALVRSADRVESELAGWISRLRGLGTGWETIAAAVGLSVDEARQRFEVPLSNGPLQRPDLTNG